MSKEDYSKSVEQLELWVNGKSVHNDERNECCPDFSCCNKEVNTPIEIRKAFQEAYLAGDQESCNMFLVKFLTAALESSEIEVLSGDEIGVDLWGSE